jgi:hypothetical protein
VSKLLELTAEISTNEDSGKRRILTHIYRDEILDIGFAMTANEAEQWAVKLQFLANECRKKNPDQERSRTLFGNKARSLKRLFTGR